MDIPKGYFDFVYSIYGIGWTTDLDGTFQKIASYLKKDGVFIFSWHHPLNYCIAWSCDERKDVIENNALLMNKSYFDESYFRMPLHNSVAPQYTAVAMAKPALVFAATALFLP